MSHRLIHSGIARSYAKAHLPWGARKLAAFLALHGGLFSLLLSKGPYTGVFRSFGDVSGSTAAVQDELAAAGAINAEPPHLDPATQFPLLQDGHDLMPLVAAMVQSAGPIRILDFGGGAGIDYGNVIRALPKEILYTIIDLPAVCTRGRQIWEDDARVRFCDELPGSDERFDIVYSWGALHYLPEPLKLLSQFALYRPQAILLIHHPFIEGEAFVRKQNNDSGSYPCWVFSVGEVTRAMADKGYRLAFHAAHRDDVNVENYPKEYRVPHSAVLLFLSDDRGR